MDTHTLQIGDRSVTIGRTPASKLARFFDVYGKESSSREERLVALAEAIYWGARRADPTTTLTAEWIDMNIDVTNQATVANGFMEFNGFVKAESGAGEADAARQP